jgi:hypothetical protein
VHKRENCIRVNENKSHERVSRSVILRNLNKMEGFKYSLIMAELKRREEGADWRANHALRELLKDKRAVFVHNHTQQPEVRSKGVCLDRRDDDGTYRGSSAVLPYGRQHLIGSLAEFEAKDDLSLVEEHFILLAKKWDAICVIYEAYKKELE